LHPLVAIIYAILLMIMVLSYNNPVILLVLFLILCVNIILNQGVIGLKQGLSYTLYAAIMIILINPLIVRQGDTVLFHVRLPVVGMINMTMEAAIFGFTMAIKLITISLIFIFYLSLQDSDDVFSFFSSYAHKLTLTFSMTLNIMHRLKLDVVRVKDTMILRGADFKSKGLIKRVKAFYPLLKVVMISSLEGSIDRAEALYARGYGRQKRTCYFPVYMKIIDCGILTLCLFFTVIFYSGLVSKVAQYSFYPRLDPIKYRDLKFCGILSLWGMLGGIVLWGGKNGSL